MTFSKSRILGGQQKKKGEPVMEAVRKEIRGGVGLVKPERVCVICPACGQQVEAVARDGRVRGYCAVARQYVEFLVEAQLERKNHYQDLEYRAKAIATLKKHRLDFLIVAASTQVREGRDSIGHFVKGNVPWNKRRV